MSEGWHVCTSNWSQTTNPCSRCSMRRNITPTSCRIQRWALMLSMHEYTLAGKPTAAHGNADAMSRLPLLEAPAEIHRNCILMMEHLQVTPITAARCMTHRYLRGCQIHGAKEQLIATGSRVGSLYYLDHQTSSHQVHAVTNGSQEKKEDVWHRRYDHLGVRNLRKLAKDNLVNDFDYDTSKEINFCEPCTKLMGSII